MMAVEDGRERRWEVMSEGTIGTLSKNETDEQRIESMSRALTSQKRQERWIMAIMMMVMGQ